MKKFANAIDRIGTENAFAVGPEIREWEKKGYDIVRVNIGEPGCNMPKASTKAAIESFKKGETHYTPSAGAETLRKEIAWYLKATHGINYQAEDVILTSGSKAVISGAIFILVNPGEEVIYPTPGYPIYESMIDFVGARRVPLALKEEKGFRFDINDLKKAISSKTKLLILNSPSNPTGGVLEKQDFFEIAKLAKKYDFYILTDEIYSRIFFGENGFPVNFKGNRFLVAPSVASEPGMAERTVIMDGFSKTFAMTGLRLGFACSKNKQFMKKFLTYAINIWSSLPQPCMVAAEASLGRDQREVQKEIRLYQEKRDKIVAQLNKIEGVKCHKPLGSFYLFPNVTTACRKLRLANAEEFRKYLLSYDRKNKKGVAVLARIHFGRRLPSEKEEYIRISFAGKLADLEEGVRRIKEAIEKK